MASYFHDGVGVGVGGAGMAKLKVFSGLMSFPDAVNGDERQTYVAMATTSQRKFMDATGLTRGFFYETGNPFTRKAAMAKPERLLFKKGRQYGDGPFVLVPEMHYGWRWKDKHGRDPEWRG